MIMKKLNNRQNQVKSLDFSNNPNVKQKQGALQKSSKIVKGQSVGKTNPTSKVPLQSEINHYAKKNNAVHGELNQQQNEQITNKQENQSTFQNSPMKPEFIQSKHTNQSFSKPGTNKGQRLHKKAISLVGGGNMGQTEGNTIDFTTSFNNNNYHGSKQAESMKQSLIQSQSTSFQDYMSTNNYPKNAHKKQKSNGALNQDKIGSLLTHQQKQALNYQQIIQNQQMSRTTAQFNNFQQPDYSNNSTQNSKGKVTMQYHQSKYVKTQGNSQNQIQTAKKRGHHQRTFSDNQQFVPPQGLNMMINPKSINPPQVTKRKLQEILSNQNDENSQENNIVTAVGLKTADNHKQNQHQVGNNLQGIAQNKNYFRSTIGSSRQSAHSSHGDHKDVKVSYYKQDDGNMDKYNELKTIYNGMFRDKIHETKEVLKLTQNNFGGPSRKVVQGKELNANTQSNRGSNQNTTNNTLATFDERNNNIKSTPKISKKNSQVKHQAKVKSQNTSSYGARPSNMSISGQPSSDKQKSRKKVQKLQQDQVQYSNNMNQQQAQNLQIVLNPSEQTRVSIKHSSQSKHRRSISDGNQTSISQFQRAQKIGFINNSLVPVKNEINYEQDKTGIAGFSLQQSKHKNKLSSGPYLNGAQNQSTIQSERHSCNTSQINPKLKQTQSNTFRHSNGNKSQISYQPSQENNDSYPITQQNSMYKFEQIPQKVGNAQKKKSNEEIRNDKITNKHNQIVNQGSLNKQNSSQKVSYMNAPLKIVEERIETQDSAVSDPNLSPKSKQNNKIIKKIKIAFQTTNNPPVTTGDFYKIGKVMGKGAFGKVNLAIHRLSEKFVALKSINKQYLSEESAKKKVMQEFNILRRFRHRNIVRLYESFETSQHIIFVMEVCGAGDLLTYVRRRRKLKEDVAKHLFRQIIQGLRYCHSKNVLHRDIKLDNILLSSQGDVKICDFGVSKLVKQNEIMTEQCGTPAYIAPEVFENKGYEKYASDIWSSGVVLYAMLYGTVPYKASNMTELQKQITKGSPSYKEEISKDAISLLKGILEKDPMNRLSAKEILKHPWMQENTDQVIVFTDQEKEKVESEFAYYNMSKDGVNENTQTDPFTEQMLNSTQNSLIKNASTKSVILAPFNSTRSHIDDNYHLRESIQGLMIDKKNLKFAPKVKEIDRQYEANNNGELDNGVYHQDDEEVEEEKKDQDKINQQKAGKSSLITSFEAKEEEDDNQIKKDIEEGQKYKKQSEWQKLEQIVIDKQKNEETEEDQIEEETDELAETQTLQIDDFIISEIEKSGYPKSYLLNSLNNDEMNYATAYYYLLTKPKEF